MNRAMLVGRITKDIELKKTQSNQSVTNFTIAISRTYTNAKGEKETDFINCVAWGRTAENMATYCAKGSLIGVEGRIQTRSYDNSNNQKVYVTEVFADSVQFLSTKSSTNDSVVKSKASDNGVSNAGDYFTDFQSKNDILSGLDISDDELPF